MSRWHAASGFALVLLGFAGVLLDRPGAAFTGALFGASIVIRWEERRRCRCRG